MYLTGDALSPGTILAVRRSEDGKRLDATTPDDPAAFAFQVGTPARVLKHAIPRHLRRPGRPSTIDAYLVSGYVSGEPSSVSLRIGAPVWTGTVHDWPLHDMERVPA